MMTSSSSSIIIKDQEAPPVVSSSEEHIYPILSDADVESIHKKCMSSTKFNPQLISGQKLILWNNTTKPKNIKEAMSNKTWIESMQDELHQFQRLDVWELVPRPADRNLIAVKWL
ncbi:hypothetical protein Tco_0196911 [Tanacetum coccineum]